jgi:hypothetical protein
MVDASPPQAVSIGVHEDRLYFLHWSQQPWSVFASIAGPVDLWVCLQQIVTRVQVPGSCGARRCRAKRSLDATAPTDLL